MSAPVLWVCEGCGAQVVAFNTPTVPAHQLCGVCAWLCEHAETPEAMMRLYNKFMDISGGRRGTGAR